MKNKIYSLLKFLIGWPFSILALFFLIKLIAPQAPQFLSQLHEISLPLLTYGMVCFLIYYFLRGYVWQRLIKQAGYNLSYKDITFIWAASELKRYIPGNIWSFVGRSVLLAEKGMNKKDIAKNTIYEMELLILGSCATSLLALPFLASYFSFPSFLIPLIISGYLLFVLFFAFNRKLKIKFFFLPQYPVVELLWLVFLSALMFFFFGLGYFFMFISYVALDPNLVWQLVGVCVLSFLVGYLSLLTPSGIGVREGALVLALSKIIPTAASGFVSLFARFMLILAEILFVSLSYLWYHAKHKWLTKLEKWIGNHQHIIIILILFLSYVIYFSAVSFLRFENLYTGKFDLGNMVQTVWNTTQGRFFTFTNPNGTEIVSRLAFHADYLLALLAPFYLLWPDPRNLLFIQTAGIAAGAFFVYLIAVEALKHKNLALVFAFAYLINPSIQRVNLYDFHAVAIATTFLLGAFYFYIKKRYRYFLLFAFLAGICKEQVWLIVSLFGVFLFFHHKKRLFGIALSVVCVSLSFFLINQAIPNALGSQHFALSYYSEYGDRPLDIVKNILFSPSTTIDLLTKPERIDYLKQLFMPLGYLSLLAPIFLLFAIPDLVINLLSNNAQLHQIYYQYTATISPFLFIAAIYGVWVLKKILSKTPYKKYTSWLLGGIVCYLLFTSLHAAYQYGPLPGAKDANLDMITKPIADKAFINEALSEIPQEAKVAASNNIASHLSNRQYLYILPLGVEEAEYVVFYLTPFQPTVSLDLDKALVEKLKSNPHYKVITEKGILIILKNVYHGS